MKGFYFADWVPAGGHYRSPVADQSLKALAATGTNWISLLVNLEQETIASTSVSRTQPRTATDDEIRRIADVAHSLGMRVVLVPNVVLSSDPTHWTGEIGTTFTGEDQWQAWFSSYREIINHYATLSQEAEVDSLSIGEALVGTTDREEDWRRIATEVRQRFKGPITYSSILGEDAGIKWWDAVDYIGMQTFYALTDKDDPTVEELKAAWAERGYLSYMEALSKKVDKPLILKFGYESKDGANRYGATYVMALNLDLQEQADCYQAALEVLWGKPWLKGIFWWQWWVGQAGGPNDSGYTPYRKPAEEVLKKFYLER